MYLQKFKKGKYSSNGLFRCFINEYNKEHAVVKQTEK